MHRNHQLRKPATRLLRVTVLALATIGACSGSPRDQISAEIQRGVRAIEKQDLDAFIDQIADEALPPDSAARRTALETFRNNTRAQWAITTHRAISVKLDSVAVTGDSATVVTTLHYDRIIDFPGRKDTMVTDLIHHELWRKTPKGWRTIRVLSAEGTQSVNGRVSQINQ